MTRGEKIRAARKKRKLTQAELAARCDLATITIRQYESGKRVPQAEQLARIAMALDVSVADLWGEDDGNFLLNKKISNYLLSFQQSVLFVDNGEISSFVLVNDEENESVENMRKVVHSMYELNSPGQAEAVKRVEELTHIPKYQRLDPKKPLSDED